MELVSCRVVVRRKKVKGDWGRPSFSIRGPSYHGPALELKGTALLVDDKQDDGN